VRPGRYNGTWAGYAFMTQDASTCDPNDTSTMTATIGAAFGGKLSMRVCYLPGGCTTWTGPYGDGATPVEALRRFDSRRSTLSGLNKPIT